MRKWVWIASGLAATATVFLVGWIWGLREQVLLLELQSPPNSATTQLIIHAKNSSFKAITIVGAQSSCSCGYVTGLPVSLASGEAVDLGLVLSDKYFAPEEPRQQIAITFFVDCGGIGKQDVVFDVGGFLTRHGPSVSR